MRPRTKPARKSRKARAGRTVVPEVRIIHVAPNRGTYTAFGYQATKAASRDGRVATSGSGVQHMRFEREKIVNQAREFERDNSLFGRVIDGATQYTIGTGFSLQAGTDDPGWNKAAEDWFKQWAEAAEVSGEIPFSEVEDLVARELFVTGDVGALLTGVDRIQLFESEQIKGKDPLSDGIEVDSKTQAVKGYWAAPWGEAGAVDWPNAAMYKPSEFLFLCKRNRPSARRAVPPCQRAFAMLHRINDVCDSEALAFQLQSRMAIAITKSGGSLVATKSSKRDATKSNADGAAAQRLTEFDAGMIVWGEPGEDVKGIERNLPGANFPNSLTMFLRLIGLPLGMPLEVILLDWTKSNYSQSRAVLEQAYATFNRWQSLIEGRFHRRVYRWVVDMGIRQKALKKRPDQHVHEWIKPTFPWIDQLAEARAKGAMLDRGFTTLASVLKGLGKDVDEVLAARDREIRKAIEISKAIKKDTDTDVPYEVFCGLEHSVNAGRAAEESEDGAEDSKSAARPGARPRKREKEDDSEDSAAAKGPTGPVSIVVKQPRGPVKTTTRVVSRDAKGRHEVVEQTHEYSPEPEAQGSLTTTTVQGLPADPRVVVVNRKPGEVA